MFRGFVYAVSSEYAYGKGKLKLGLTIHPVHRMRQYDTGDAPGIGLEKRFHGLWETNATDRKMLRKIEAALHKRFEACRLPRENGRKSEWFSVTYEQVAEFLSTCPYIIKRIPDDEISEIQTKAKQRPTKEERITEKDDVLEEKEWSEEQQDALETLENLREKFLRVFLGDKPLRRNQAELWDLFEKRCESEEHLDVRGIVQWVTGVGKTFAMLMMIVLAAERSKRRGEIYRGLLIAPQNNIFDTIINHIHKLQEFGITVCEGHNAKLSSLHIPRDTHVLVTATHTGLVVDDIMKKLPSMTHVHYDEVHRISGDQLFELLKLYLPIWNSEFVTGTSATPKTANTGQHKKLSEIFGDPVKILHRCDVDEAVREGWIAKPRFSVTVVPKNLGQGETLRMFLRAIRSDIEEKQRQGKWRGGKVITYIPLRSMVCDAVRLASEEFPDTWKIYTAVEDAEAMDDCKFVSDEADGTPRILFACERYREGSDIYGLEMTSIFMGNTIAVNIIIQIIGRALRADYEGKEGWCCIFRPSEQGETEEDVFDNIMLEIAEILVNNDAPLEKGQFKKILESFVGTATIRGMRLSVDETIERVQAAYERRLWERGEYSYTRLKKNVRDMNIQSEKEYDAEKKEKGWPADPRVLAGWRSFYDLHHAGEETRHSLSDLKDLILSYEITDIPSYTAVEDLPPWQHLLEGYLTDHPSPLQSFLETQLFFTQRQGRR